MKKRIAQFISLFFRIWYKTLYGKRVQFGKKVILNGKFRFKGPGKLVIGDNANLWSHKERNEFFTFDKDASISIGERTRMNGAGVQCRKSVTIGKDVLIGSAILIDNDFHSVHYEHRNDQAFIKSKPITIGDRVWLAGQCAILKGVTVGDEAVVGFRAVVTRDVAPRTVVAGNPAREVAILTKQSES